MVVVVLEGDSWDGREVGGWVSGWGVLILGFICYERDLRSGGVFRGL